MNASRFLSLLWLVSFLPVLALSQAETKPALIVPVVSIRDTLPLGRALAELRKQTGIAVHDGLDAADRDVSVALEKASFWQATDTLAAAAGAKTVLAGRDGAVSLQPLLKGDRRPPVSYDGPFRVRAVRITTSRDLDSDRGSCVVSLEVTWTPTLRPLFLESQAQQVRLRDARGKDIPVSNEGSSLAPVDGRYSLPLDVTIPALPREQAHIGALEGKLLAVAPSKMVRFAFDADLAALADAAPGGAQRRAVQDEVASRITKVVLGRESWSVQVALDYPPKGNHMLESFQAGSLVANNELALASKDGKRSLASSSYVIDQVSSDHALVTYHFTDRPGAVRRGRAADWKVAYMAPARIVEVPFRFAFKDLPLP